MATDTQVQAELFTKAQAAYERGRRSWAVRHALPVAVLPAVSYVVGGRGGTSLLLGAALVVLMGVFLWGGRGLARGAWAGLFAGIPGLAAAHCAQLMGHVCMGSGCYSLCLPACVAGGVVGGFMVARAVRRSPWPVPTATAAFGVAIVTAAMGCACVGASGVVGLVLGLGSSAGVGLLVKRPAAA